MSPILCVSTLDAFYDALNRSVWYVHGSVAGSSKCHECEVILQLLQSLRLQAYLNNFKLYAFITLVIGHTSIIDRRYSIKPIAIKEYSYM